jgi:hypothetical protein
MPVNAVELRVVGMSRSGSHAVVNWILHQAAGRVCFLNCAEPRTNPFHSARPLDTGDCAVANWPGFDPAAERAGRFAAKDWLVYSYEDTFLKPAFDPAFDRHHDAWVGSSARRHDVLVVRDPFNLFASRHRWGRSPLSAAIARRMWTQHARIALDPAGCLRHGPVVVRYNAWVADPGYRRRIAETLGLRFTDAGRNEVGPSGGGSSFDGYALDGRAGGMAVLDRWRLLADDPDYRRLLGPEMAALSERLFGPLPGTEALAGTAPASAVAV